MRGREGTVRMEESERREEKGLNSSQVSEEGKEMRRGKSNI